MGYKKGNQSFVNANPFKKQWRTLTNAEIEEVAKKDWKESPPRSSFPAMNKRLQNLTGPKSEEAKRNSVANLRPNSTTPMPKTHGGYIKQIINDDEREFYAERQEKYIEDFELNESSDAILLHSVLIEEVILRRLMLYASERPSEDIDGPLTACHGRLKSSLKALGMTREQRLAMKINVTETVADLASRVAKEIEEDKIKMKRLREEEERILKDRQKKKREDDERTVDAVYEMVDDKEVDPNG